MYINFGVANNTYRSPFHAYVIADPIFMNRSSNIGNHETDNHNCSYVSLFSQLQTYVILVILGTFYNIFNSHTFISGVCLLPITYITIKHIMYVFT